jgi:streptogramin lyase
MLNGRKVGVSLLTLAMLVGSAVLAFSILGNGLRSTYASGVTFQDFYIPSSYDPWGTAFDSNGNVWLAIPGCDPAPMCSSSTPPGKIAEFNPATSNWIATYQLPTGYAQPLFLAFDAQGRLWFPMPMDNSIGMLDPSNKTFQQWAVPTASAGPWDVAVDHNGMIWFTEHYVNKIGRFDPVAQAFMEVATPASNSQPYGIVVDASNNIWFTENNSSVALIAEYTLAGTLQEYKVRNSVQSGLTPHLITVDPNGNVWWTEGWFGMIGELNVALAVPGTNNGVTEYAYQRVCSTCGTHASGIAVDSSGLVWFDDSLQNIFGSFPYGGSGWFTTYSVLAVNAHPHDGLNVDAQNRIWFDEEFANKLGKAVQNNFPTPTPTPGSSPTSTNTVVPSPTPTLTPVVTPLPSPSPGATIAQDTFQRVNQTFWGTASDGHTWGGNANSSSAFSIVANTGQVSNGSTSYNAVLGAVATDAQVLFSGSLSNFNSSNLGAVIRWTNGNNWYKAYISGTSLVIQKRVSGTATILGKVPFAATAGMSYTLRFSVIGSTLSAKVWQTGNPEPANWMVTVSDSTFQSGYCGLRMLIQNGAVANITSFIATTQ